MRRTVLDVLVEAAAWRRRKHLPAALRAELLAGRPWLFEQDVRGQVDEVDGRGPSYRSTRETKWMPMTVVATSDRLVVWGKGTKWVDVPPGHPWLRDVVLERPDRLCLISELADSHVGISGRLEVRVTLPQASAVATWLTPG